VFPVFPEIYFDFIPVLLKAILKALACETVAQKAIAFDFLCFFE